MNEKKRRREYKIEMISSFFYFRKFYSMNGNHHNNNLMCNQNQILKNLPLKKRRTYLTNDEQDENYSKIIKPFVAK
jgi:hypothetical protein